jgi:hypothetical protein
MKLTHPLLAQTREARGAVPATEETQPPATATRRAYTAPKIPPATEVPGRDDTSETASEVALLQIMRILNRAQSGCKLTPVERAVLIGARALFEQLTATCDNLLAPAVPKSPATLAATLTHPEPTPAPTARATRRKQK